MKIYLIAFFIFFSASANFAQKDSTTLHITEFLEIVRLYHPIVKLSNIAIKKSEADITIARGAFNPIISNIIANKTVANSTYYDYFNPNITIPTWYAIEVSAGIENLSGNRFDPSETVGKSSYIGVNIPLLKNLVIDKRRAYLKQSKLYNEMAFTEQQALINNIMMEATTQYWEWVNAYQTYEVIKKNLIISQNRFEMVKKIYKNGERAAIDTTEAMYQFQTFEFQSNESWLKFQKERIELSAFLWQANNNPYLLPENIVPQKGWDNEANVNNFDINLPELLANAQQVHPELLLYNNKFRILEIDKKLKFQELLPKLDFKYNHLSKGYNAFASDGLLFRNNYQYGLKLEMPLLFSQGRGQYMQAKLKIEEAHIAQSQKLLTIELKLKNYYNEFQTLKSQIQLQKGMLSSLEKMLRAEERLFQNGESSLFLINSRENKVLETERKLIELKTKYCKSIYALQWSAGLLR